MEQIPKGWQDFLREQFPEGSRIRLKEMKNAPCPVEPGSMGTLLHIDDAGIFHVQFDNGRELGVALGEDSFTVLPPGPQTLKLYMPLTADYYEPDQWGDMPEEGAPLDGRGLLAYEDHILTSLLKERGPEEAERGLMHYYGKTDSVDEKVLSYAPQPVCAEGLPELCFSTLTSTGALICIKRGESGYYPSGWDTGDPAQNRELADFNNGKLGVTPAQRLAMEAGAMHGWTCPAADPRAYEQTPQQMGGMTI